MKKEFESVVVRVFAAEWGASVAQEKPDARWVKVDDPATTALFELRTETSGTSELDRRGVVERYEEPPLWAAGNRWRCGVFWGRGGAMLGWFSTEEAAKLAVETAWGLFTHMIRTIAIERVLEQSEDADRSALEEVAGAGPERPGALH